MATELIRIGTMEFEDIKASLKLYLSNQDAFTDYNMEAAGITQIINLLAYNTHYNALSANLLANEMFLDTAVKRSSIVSRAKELGYTPKSRRAAHTSLTISFTTIANQDSISSLILPAGTLISSSVNDSSFTFTTTAPVFANKIIEDGVPVFRGVAVVYEGVLSQVTSTYDSTLNVVAIPNGDIDTSTLKVEVLDNQTWVEYYSPQSHLNVTETSTAFFLQEGSNGYEIYFGDNVIGQRPANLSQVRMTYVVTSGQPANGAANYTFSSIISGMLSNTVVTVAGAIAAGGQEIESKDSIKYNAKNSYGTQNRAVTAKDYAVLAAQNFTKIKDVIAWDGAQNTPPKFGKIIMCIQPTVGDVLPITEKRLVSDYLIRKGVGNVKIDFEDPDYIELLLTCIVKYNIKYLKIGEFELEHVVKANLAAHARDKIQRFGGAARFSSISAVIDKSDYSIVGNELTINVNKALYPVLFSTNSFSFSYKCPIKSGSISSTGFFINNSTTRLKIKDANGTLNAYTSSDGKNTIVLLNVGKVDYVKGEIILTDLYISRIVGIKFNVSATPASLDVFSNQNMIIKLEPDNMKVLITRDTQV